MMAFKVDANFLLQDEMEKKRSARLQLGFQ